MCCHKCGQSRWINLKTKNTIRQKHLSGKVFCRAQRDNASSGGKNLFTDARVAIKLRPVAGKESATN
jgi:hypothetical protein